MKNDRSEAERLPIQKTDPAAILPTRAHPGDAGLDLYSLEEGRIGPGEGLVARTGIAVALPYGTVGLVADRSSMAKKGVKTAGGVIDAGYRGEVGIVLWNLSAREFRFAAGERIAQLLVLPCLTPEPIEREDLGATARGEGGFGSTGR